SSLVDTKSTRDVPGGPSGSPRPGILDRNTCTGDAQSCAGPSSVEPEHEEAWPAPRTTFAVWSSLPLPPKPATDASACALSLPPAVIVNAPIVIAFTTCVAPA